MVGGGPAGVAASLSCPHRRGRPKATRVPGYGLADTYVLPHIRKERTFEPSGSSPYESRARSQESGIWSGDPSRSFNRDSTPSSQLLLRDPRLLTPDS